MEAEHSKIVQEFAEPGTQYRAAPFWAWNTELNADMIQRQIGIFKEMGFGGFHIHPRVGLETPYLGKEFMDMVAACVEKARQEGLAACLYDEDRWPSGFAGGIVTKNPEYRMKHLLFTRRPYGAGWGADTEPVMGNFAVGIRSENGVLLSCYDIRRNKDGELAGYRLLDEDDEAEGEKWYAYLETNPEHTWYNNQTYADVLSKEAMDSFIECTHEVYKKHLGDKFGRIVPSIFTDEPHHLYKTNLRSAGSGEDLLFPWTEQLPERVARESGLLVLAMLPELFWELPGGSISQFRYCVHKAVADLFEEAYAANIGSWCQANHIASTGHYLYEESLYLQNRSGGDLLRMYRHMDIPGMDLLFNEVCLTTARQVSSVVNQYGKPGAMSELYGATGWDFDFRGHKFQGDWQAALGITLRVPHLSLMTMKGERKRDFPASIFYQAPWYREYKILEDHYARINLLMGQGEVKVQMAMIHPIESYWLAFGPEDQTGAQREMLDHRFRLLTEWLLPNGFDFDYLSEGLIPELCREPGYPLKAGQMQYKVMIIPGCITLRSTTLAVLEEFAKAGGRILVFGDYPEAVDGQKSSRARLMLEQWGQQVVFEREAVLKAAASCREVDICRLDGTAEDGYLRLYKYFGQDRLLFLAPVKEPEDKDSVSYKELVITADGRFTPIFCDTFSGEFHILTGEYKDGRTSVKRRMYGYDSLLIWLRAEAWELEPDEPVGAAGAEGWTPVKLSRKVSYELAEPNVLVMDIADAYLDGKSVYSQEEILRIDSGVRKLLGYDQRSFAMAQPYTRTRRTTGHRLLLRYLVYSKADVSGVSLALEEADGAVIRWNGRDILPVWDGWYVDEKIRKMRLGDIRAGENVLELELPFEEHTDLEAMYLLGDFGVSLDGRQAVIDRRPDTLAFGSVVGQGLDFYSASISYMFPVACPDGKLKIRAGKYKGGLIEVVIDKERAGTIIFPPYEFVKTGLMPGEHLVELRLLGNRSNTFAPLHLADKKKRRRSFPYLWKTVGEDWSYEYQVGEFGILSEPEVFV